MRVAIPQGTNQTPFTVAATATSSGVQSGSTGGLDMIVGQNADPDSSFTLAPSTVSGAGNLSGSTVSLKVGVETDVFMDAEFTVADDYEVTLTSVPASPAGWNIDLATPAVNQSGHHVIPVSSQDVANAPNHQVGEAIAFSLIPPQNATPIQARVVVKGSNATKSHTYTFDVQPHA